ncbi:MAG: arylsulfatase [Nitrospinaceae bacterium]|nr:MAG: arylsulfatase [Nitrospinaceae bacterium]
MKITILGSGTSVPSLERNSSGVLLQKGGTHSLIDCGYGTLHQLLRLGLTYKDIDRIYFTHIHPDHMYDLVPMLFAARYPEDLREKKLEIVAGPGFQEFFEGLLKAYKGWLTPKRYEIKIIEQDEATRKYDGLSVTTRKVKHIPISRGYRMTDEKGKTAAFSGDTDTCDGMIELGRDADLMVLECATPDELKVDGHLSPTPAAKLAQTANCKKLCLTHFYPPCDLTAFRKIVAREYTGELFLAEDLMVFQL